MKLETLIKKGTPALLPHEIALITDSGDPLYDARIDEPIDDAAVLNQVVVGVVQAAAVGIRDGVAIAVDGCQRTKRGLVINDLGGHHKYKGEVEAIKECIARLRDPKNETGKRITELAGVAPHKIPVTVLRDKGVGTYIAKASANVYRLEENRRTLAQKAQMLSGKYHLSNKEIGDHLKCSTKTVERLLALDLDAAPKGRKKQSKTRKPGAKRVSTIADAMTELLRKDDRSLVLLGWVRGEVKDSELFEAYDGLKGMIEMRKDQKRETEKEEE